jgi:hypothetical protein
MIDREDDRRSEERVPGADFHSVELSLPELDYVYQFNLWNLSSQGLCFLVRMDSPVLDFLHVGSELEMKFYGPESPEPPRILRARIQHVSPAAEGRFRNHTLVGLSILDAASPLAQPGSASP